MLPLLLGLSLIADIAPRGNSTVYKQPQIASIGSNAGIVFGADNTIYYSGSTDEGNTFADPVIVARSPAPLSLGNHRGPRLAFTQGAIVVTAGVGSTSAGFSPNDLRSWRSTDGGKTWAEGPRISDAGGAGMGFNALASDSKQRLWAAWLGQQNNRVKLFSATSENEGKSWSKPRVLYESPDGNVCECCHPSVAIADNGNIYVMWRNSLGGARDLYLATSLDAGQSFHIVKLGKGTWPLEACPMDGGGLAELDGDVVTVWRRQTDLFIARPDGKPEEHLATGRNAAVALRKAGNYALWTSDEGLMAKTPGRAEPYVLSKTGGFPSITAHGRVIAVWEDNGRIRTERLD
jgi:hypothetical protein